MISHPYIRLAVKIRLDGRPVSVDSRYAEQGTILQFNSSLPDWEIEIRSSFRRMPGGYARGDHIVFTNEAPSRPLVTVHDSQQRTDSPPGARCLLEHLAVLHEHLRHLQLQAAIDVLDDTLAAVDRSIRGFDS